MNMCKIKVVVRREMLGAREQCWSLWTEKGVLEMTSKQIKEQIEKGEEIKGLKVDKGGELVPDIDGFFTTNIMEHRCSNQYKPMIETDVMVNQFYICLGCRIVDKEKVYDCISTKFEQVTLTEADMKAYLKLEIVSGGAKLDNDKIVLATIGSPEPQPEPQKVPDVKEQKGKESKIEKK